MINVVGSTDDFSRWKPEQYRHYLTMGEVATIVGRDKSRLKQLEREGKLASPIRVKVGRHHVRLYSPEEVAKIEEHFKNVTTGRPRRRRRRTP